jgi:hypothetical protein
MLQMDMSGGGGGFKFITDLTNPGVPHTLIYVAHTHAFHTLQDVQPHAFRIYRCVPRSCMCTLFLVLCQYFGAHFVRSAAE